MGGGFQDTGAQALPAHFHQAKAGNTADLHAGAIIFQRLLHGLFDLADVGTIFHVDEIDHHQAGHVAQTQLAADLVGGFQVGLGGGFLDAIFAGRAPGVDVDRHQSLGRVDDQITTRFQLDDRLVHGFQLILDTEALEQWHAAFIFHHLGGVAGHQHRHEAVRGVETAAAFHKHLIDLAIVDVADGALDETRIFMNQRRGLAGQGLLADLVPEAGKIIEIAADIGGAALQAGGAHDGAHAVRQVQIGHHLLQALAIGRVGNLARNAATVRGVGHQHAVATGEAEIGGERCALGAALFLHHLDQHHLAAADDFLDLVTAAQRHALATQRIRRFIMMAPGFQHIIGFITLFAVVAMIVGGQFGFLAQQGVAIFLGDLIIIGVDFGKCQEAVAVAAVFHERRLQRRFNPGHLGEIDIAFELTLISRFEIKFLDALAVDHGHPCFFRVAGVDKHAIGH